VRAYEVTFDGSVERRRADQITLQRTAPPSRCRRAGNGARDAPPAGVDPSGTRVQDRSDRPDQRGFIDVHCIPSAAIRLDGRNTGHSTPHTFEVPAGPHRVTLVTETGRIVQRTVEVPPGGRAVVSGNATP
jgi:hypothetical protein